MTVFTPYSPTAIKLPSLRTTMSRTSSMFTVSYVRIPSPPPKDVSRFPPAVYLIAKSPLSL